GPWRVLSVFGHYTRQRRSAQQCAASLKTKNSAKNQKPRPHGRGSGSRASPGLVMTIRYFASEGLPNLDASIATLVFTSLIFAVYRPSSQRNVYSNGNLIPLTSR